MKMLLLAFTLMAGFAAQANVSSNPEPALQQTEKVLPCGKKVTVGLLSNTNPSTQRPVHTAEGDSKSAVK